MKSIRILADDLTGALDAAAPFATSTHPVQLLLADAFLADKQTASSESRELDLCDALSAVRANFDKLRPGTDESTLWFKKIDSVLRGWPVEETLELMRCLNLKYCVFAPAIPEMGRRTISGMHEIADATKKDLWSPAVIHDLGAAFQAVGAFVSVLGEGEANAGILIGNAESPGDLRALASSVPRHNTLWAGSRGLAEALCPPRSLLHVPRLGTVIIGTSHPVTRMQVDLLRQTAAARRMTVIDPVPTSVTAEQTMECLYKCVAAMDHPGAAALVVVGGNTLTAVLSTLGAQSLTCRGEVARGLPVSTISGGRFDGVTVVSKSGGFGDADLLATLGQFSA